MSKLLITLILPIFCAISANAQTAKMASVYTNMSVDCQPETKIEADEVPLICRAVGDFRLRIVPAGAWAEMLEIVDNKGKSVVSLGTHGYGFSTAKNKKLEWRTANGKPFAVILRINNYDEKTANNEGENPYSAKYKTGETLIVKGWKKYDFIDYEFDGQEKDANLKAQKKADSNF